MDGEDGVAVEDSGEDWQRGRDPQERAFAALAALPQGGEGEEPAPDEPTPNEPTPGEPTPGESTPGEDEDSDEEPALTS